MVWLAMGRAAGHAHRLADAGVEQAQVVVDLRDRGHGGAGVPAGGLLFDGDGRRQALDAVHVGLLHLVQELPGVGAEALHVAALPLGVEGVEGQAGLAAPGEAGDHHQAVAGEDQVEVLEVVLPGSLDVNAVHDCLDLASYAKFSSSRQIRLFSASRPVLPWRPPWGQVGRHSMG